MVKRLIVSKILKSRIAPDINGVDGAILEASVAGKLAWKSMVPAIVKKLVGQGDLESEMAEEYAHRLGEDLDNVSAKALKQGYTASLGKGIDRSLSWARVTEAWGLDGRQMRAFIGTMPKQDYSGEAVPPKSRATLDTMINTRADRIKENESYAIGQLAQQVHWVKLRETGEVGPDVTKQWHTAADEFVCPVCGPIHGKIVGITKTFSRGVFAPPVHPSCRCWVELLEGSTIVTKRDYNRDSDGQFARTNTLVSQDDELDQMMAQERAHWKGQGFDLKEEGDGDFSVDLKKPNLEAAVKRRGLDSYPGTVVVAPAAGNTPSFGKPHGSTGQFIWAGNKWSSDMPADIEAGLDDGRYHTIRITEEHHGQIHDKNDLYLALHDYGVSYDDYANLVANGTPASFNTTQESRKAVAYDIDGIIASGDGGLSTRTVNQGILKQMQNDKRLGYDVIIITNRPNGWRDKTEQWLTANDIPYDLMLMPPKDTERAKMRLGDTPDSRGLVSNKLENLLLLEERGFKIEAFYENDNNINRGLAAAGFKIGTDEIDPEPATKKVNEQFTMTSPSGHPFGRDIGFHEGQPRPTAQQIKEAKGNTRKLKGGKGGWDIVEGRPVDNEGNLLPGSATINLRSSTGEQAWLLPTRDERYNQTIYSDWQDKNTPRELFTKDEYWNRLWERGTPYQHSLREDEIFTPEEIAAKKKELTQAYKEPPKKSEPFTGLRENSFAPKRGEHEAMAELPNIGYERMVGFDRQGNYEGLPQTGGKSPFGTTGTAPSHYVIDRRADKPLWDSRALLMETKGDRTKYDAQRGPDHLPYDVIMKDPRPQHKPVWGIYDSESKERKFHAAPGYAPPGWKLHQNVDYPMGWSGFYTGLTGNYRSHPSTSAVAPPAKFVKDDKALNNPYTPKGYKMPPVRMTEEIYKRLKEIRKAQERAYARDKEGQFSSQNTLIRNTGGSYRTIVDTPTYAPQPRPMPAPAGPPRPPTRNRPIEALLTPVELREVERQMAGKTTTRKPPSQVKFATLADALDSVANQPDTRRTLRSEHWKTREPTPKAQPANQMIAAKTADVRETIYDAKVRAGQTPIKRDPRYVVMNLDKRVAVATKPVVTEDPRVVFVNVAPKVGEKVSFNQGPFYATTPGHPDATPKPVALLISTGLTVHPMTTAMKNAEGKTEVKNSLTSGLATGNYTVTDIHEVTDDPDGVEWAVEIAVDPADLEQMADRNPDWLTNTGRPARANTKEREEFSEGFDYSEGDDEHAAVEAESKWIAPPLSGKDEQGWSPQDAEKWLAQHGENPSEFRMRPLPGL